MPEKKKLSDEARAAQKAGFDRIREEVAGKQKAREEQQRRFSDEARKQERGNS